MKRVVVVELDQNDVFNAADVFTRDLPVAYRVIREEDKAPRYLICKELTEEQLRSACVQKVRDACKVPTGTSMTCTLDLSGAPSARVTFSTK